MKIFRIAAGIMMLAGPFMGPAAPALAQDGPHVNLLSDVPSKTPEEREADEKRERAYKDSMKKIPDAKAPTDPWGAVRTSDAPKTATPAKSKTRTGSNSN